ncbi:MAG: NUDIX domain-containing protein [Acidobacteriaceae bacterium]
MRQQQVSTGALIVNEENKFLILKRADKEDFLPGYWEIPGGGSDYGETPEEAIKREVKEECDLNVKAQMPLFIGNYMLGEKQRIEINFLCRLIDQNSQPKMSEEHQDFAWVSFEEIGNYKMSDYMKEVIAKSLEHLKNLKSIPN